MKTLMVTGLVFLAVIVIGQVVLLKKLGDVPLVPPVVSVPASPAEVSPVLPPLPDTLPALPPVGMQKGLEDFIRLVKSGAGEDVLLGKIRASQDLGELSADELIYLNDIGTPQRVIVEWMNRAAELRRSAALATPPATPAQPPELASTTPPVSDAVPIQLLDSSAVEGVQPAVTVVTSPLPGQVNDTDFYQALSPYGAWIAVDNGWAWRPAVAVVDSAWRPYCQGGHWIYTDCGWTWYSDYSWGWAPFHYGRWLHHGQHGWVWFPGRTWGPAWVSWRTDDRHCGWAPLPPAAHYSSGVGFAYHGRNVDMSFGFGLGVADYVFVESGRFCDPAPHRYVLPSARVAGMFGRTVVHNNYTQHDRFVINGGPDLRRVEQAYGKPIPRRTLVDETRPAGHLRPVVDARQNTLPLYRPKVQLSAPKVETLHQKTGNLPESRPVKGSSIMPAAILAGSRPAAPTVRQPVLPELAKAPVTVHELERGQRELQASQRKSQLTAAESIQRVDSTRRQQEQANTARHQQEQADSARRQQEQAANELADRQKREQARQSTELKQQDEARAAASARRQQEVENNAIAEAQAREAIRQAAASRREMQENQRIAQENQHQAQLVAAAESRRADSARRQQDQANAARHQQEQADSARRQQEAQARAVADTQQARAMERPAMEVRRETFEIQRRVNAADSNRISVERTVTRPADSSTAISGTVDPRIKSGR